MHAVCRVEYQGIAEQLLTAFQQANRVPASAGTAATAAAGPAMFASDLDVDQRFDFSGQLGSDQFDHLGPSLLISLPDAARRRSNSHSSSPSAAGSRSGSSSDDEDDSHSSSSSGSRRSNGKPQTSQQHVSSQLSSAKDAQRQQQPPSSNNSSSSAVATKQSVSDTAATATTPGAAEQDAAAAADAAFMQLLLLLAQRAAFVPLSERDVALGVSLNTDFLWQLFVKVSTEQLDATLVPPQLLGGTAAAAPAGAAAAAAAGGGATGRAAGGVGGAAQLLKETESLLVLRCVTKGCRMCRVPTHSTHDSFQDFFLSCSMHAGMQKQHVTLFQI